jgi:DNA-binding MarR family transcriptional regulator
MTYPDPRLSSFGYVLWQLSHIAQQRMTESLAEMNLTLQQLGALIHLARGDATSTADLARMTVTTPQNMSLTVAKLEAAGYVTRRPHEQHGRIHVLDVTAVGTRSLRRAIVRVTKVEDEMLRGVPASEREHLTLAMRDCLKRLQIKKTKQR